MHRILKILYTFYPIFIPSRTPFSYIYSCERILLKYNYTHINIDIHTSTYMKSNNIKESKWICQERGKTKAPSIIPVNINISNVSYIQGVSYICDKRRGNFRKKNSCGENGTNEGFWIEYRTTVDLYKTQCK